MRLLDRWPKGREGAILAIAVGVVAALLGSAAAVYTLSDEKAGTDTATEMPSRSGDPLIPVVSRAGGFALRVPGDLVGSELKRGVKLTTESEDIVITVGSTGRQGLRAGHATALDAIRTTFPKMRVEKNLRTELGALQAQRSVGVVRRARGDGVVFSVTTGVSGKRTWSVVMFAARDIDPERLERFYQPVLDSFVLVE